MVELKQQDINSRVVFQLHNTMEEQKNRNSEEAIKEATERVKSRLPLEKLRFVPKYRDLSADDCQQLMKNAETFALLILRAFVGKK